MTITLSAISAVIITAITGAEAINDTFTITETAMSVVIIVSILFIEPGPAGL